MIGGASRGGETAGDLTIRPASVGDRGFVLSLSREAFGRFGPYDRILLHEMVRVGVRTRVAELAGRPVGFAMDELAYGETYLVAVAVVPDLRRTGVGRALLRAVEGDAAGGVGLTVADENAPARALFASEGYRDVPGTTEPYPFGQRARRMRKAIG